MSLFLLTFFFVYGGMHLYAYLKVRSASVLPSSASIFLILFMVCMVIAPVTVRLSERAGLESFARAAAFAGYLWMGLLFLFFSSSLLIDLYRLILFLSGKVFNTDISSLLIPPRYALFIPLMASLLIAAYGYHEAQDVRTERLTIKSSKIPKEAGKITVVQISDVHLGLIVREKQLERILREVKNADPDIFISTGDLVDGQVAKLDGLSDLLREIRPKYGKFAITGNHEFYAGLEQSLDFTRKAGFSLLRGEGLTVAGLINIAGVDDPAGKYFGPDAISEQALLSALPREKFTLFLKHRPLIDRKALGLFDLQLSGHVHKGQIFPFSLLTRIYYPVYAGFAQFPLDSHLYVSRGSGTWGPPIRFLSPPEVTVIELINDR